MIIYDITQELFSTTIYPGDPIPTKKSWLSIENGDICNLTILSLGSHSGTHIDAPKHFIAEGKDVAELSLDKCIGYCEVIYCNGRITSEFLAKTLEEGTDKILLRGNVILDEEFAKSIVKCKINLIGVEMPTVGDEVSQKQVHKILLENEVVILENLNLDKIPEGKYFLVAQPLKMDDVDGSPVRALLIVDK